MNDVHWGTGPYRPRADPYVAHVIGGVLRAVPEQPWQTYRHRAALAAADALTDLDLCQPERSRQPGIRGWWNRRRCRHIWRMHAEADYRCIRCGASR